MKVPVISTEITGIPEVVFDGETGFLTDVGNVEQFAEAIEKSRKILILVSKWAKKHVL